MSRMKSSLHWLLPLLLLVGLCSQEVSAIEVLDSLSSAQTGDIFFSAPYRASPNALLNETKTPERVAIHGALTLPELTGGRVPAAVIVHTSVGIRPHVHDAAKALNGAGIAAFVIDSHSTRGGKFSVDEARNLIPTRTADAYAALLLLATHPLIDPARIAVVGYSSGGTVALFTASRHIRRTMTGDKASFAAHVAWYPYCWAQLAEPDATGAPVLMLLAQEDNQTPIVQCQDFGKRIEASGAPVQYIAYPGAYHAFDFPGLAGRVIKSRITKDVSNCVERIFLVQPDGKWFAPSLNRHAANIEEFGDLTKDCASGPASLGGPPGVTKTATQDMLTFLRKVFGLPKSG